MMYIYNIDIQSRKMAAISAIFLEIIRPLKGKLNSNL